MDMDRSGYLVCDPLFYRIDLYDLNDQLCDSIIAPDTAFTRSSSIKFERQFNALEIANDPSPHLPELADYLSEIDRIWTVNFIDKNTIFVRLSRNSLNKTKDRRQQLFDHVWKKTNGLWRLVVIKEIADLNSSSFLNSKNDLWPYFVPGSKFFFQNGYLYHSFWSSSSSELPQSVGDFYGATEINKEKLRLKVVTFFFGQP